MKNFLAKIWFPTLLVTVAAFQSFGIDSSRALNIAGFRDTLTLSRIEDTSAAVAFADSSALTDSIVQNDTIAPQDTLGPQDTIVPRDTIRIPANPEF